MAQVTDPKAKGEKKAKTIDEKLKDAVDTLMKVAVEKSLEDEKSPDAKALIKIIKTEVKAKADGKKATEQAKVDGKIMEFMKKTSPYKEDYQEVIKLLARASLDAQSAPAKPKEESAKPKANKPS